jgi:gluconolactonase
MDGEIVASELVFPEGPVWRDGELLFTEIDAGRVSRWTAADGVRALAATGGGPNGAALGPDGTVYVTQNGGTGDRRTTPGIQRIDAAGTVELRCSSVADLELGAPNDLAFGPDGRLWFTDPRAVPDPERNVLPGRIFAIDPESGQGELVLELGPVFPNGIAFTADGSLVWTESFNRRVMTWSGGEPSTLIELPARHAPDGLCVGADGRLYVAATFSHSVCVIDDGEIVERFVCGDGMCTNCCFGGTDLYVTESRRGTVWRFAVGCEGLALPFA